MNSNNYHIVKVTDIDAITAEDLIKFKGKVFDVKSLDQQTLVFSVKPEIQVNLAIAQKLLINIAGGDLSLAAKKIHSELMKSARIILDTNAPTAETAYNIVSNVVDDTVYFSVKDTASAVETPFLAIPIPLTSLSVEKEIQDCLDFMKDHVVVTSIVAMSETVIK